MLMSDAQKIDLLKSINLQGWCPAFVCGRILECARSASYYRSLERISAIATADLHQEEAIWYYKYLVEKSRNDLKSDKSWGRPWTLAYTKMLTLLSPEEMELLDTALRHIGVHT